MSIEEIKFEKKRKEEQQSSRQMLNNPIKKRIKLKESNEKAKISSLMN